VYCVLCMSPSINFNTPVFGIFYTSVHKCLFNWQTFFYLATISFNNWGRLCFLWGVIIHRKEFSRTQQSPWSPVNLPVCDISICTRYRFHMTRRNFSLKVDHHHLKIYQFAMYRFLWDIDLIWQGGIST